MVKPSRWAFVMQHTVAEVTLIDPKDRFHPAMPWHACDEQVEPGWRLIDGQFLPPEPAWDNPGSGERQQRDLALDATQWLTARHREELDLGSETRLTPTQYNELLIYRQALRAWPEHEQFPQEAYRPRPPEWLATL